MNSDSLYTLQEQVAAVIDKNIINETCLDKDDYITAESPGIQKLLREWASNKQRFISRFDGELIKNLGEINITPNVTESDESYYLSDFISKVIDYEFNARISYEEFVNLTNFFEKEKHGFLINQVTNDYSISDFFLNKGRKISRCIKYFIKNDETVRELQDLYSTYLQKRKIKGELCISVHPLDYLSSSENNYNWRSCHALNGEYKGGNLSYMIDNTTIVCYIKGRDEEKLPRFPDDVLWNDKKWRMLIHISPDKNNFIAFGRPYPFESDELRDLIYEKLKEVYSECSFSPLKQIKEKEIKINYTIDNTVISSTTALRKCVNFDGSYIPRNEIIDDEHGTCFNDLLESSFYDFWYFYSKSDKPYTPITVGLEPCCARCGRHFPSSEFFLCDDCRDDLGSLYVEPELPF